MPKLPKHLRCNNSVIALVLQLLELIWTCRFLLGHVKQQPVSGFGHPLGATEVAIMHLAGTIRLSVGINLKDDLHSLAPVRTFRICVK